MDDIAATESWLEGPTFLRNDRSTWSIVNPDDLETPNADPEIRKSLVIHATKFEEDFSIVSSLEQFSSWRRMVRLMATMLKFIDCCKQKAQAKYNNLTANEISSAEKMLLLLFQKKYFKEELTTYHPGSKPKTNKGRRNFGNLWKLDQ